MRIALLSTCATAVPPKGYGGTELIVYELAKNLTRLGHDVVTYATGDSSPDGELWHLFEKPVWPPLATAELRHCALALRDMEGRSPPFDVVHTNIGASLPLMHDRFELPVVLTIHHDRDPYLTGLFEDAPWAYYVAISHRQAECLTEIEVDAVVHHGLNPEQYQGGEGGGKGGYCVFLGRLAREKGPHVAIAAAMRAGVPLTMAGKAHPPDEEYFAAQVKPAIEAAGPLVNWIGEVGYPEKVELLHNACAMLFPIDWEEPFGLVMIESMLVGTPVIAFRRGSAPEVVEPGVTGFLVDNEEQMAACLRNIDRIDREACRRRARERWSSMRMARQYEQVYRKVIARHGSGTKPGLWPVRLPDPAIATGTDDSVAGSGKGQLHAVGRSGMDGRNARPRPGGPARGSVPRR
jgi:glycosyltransferase involved in cell wall biosynthesis